MRKVIVKKRKRRLAKHKKLSNNTVIEIDNCYSLEILKLLYEEERRSHVTQVSVKPPTFVIFVNDRELMHFSYTRYLENKIRETFGFKGTSLKFIIRERKEQG